MFKINRHQQGEGAVKKSILKLFDHKKDVGTRLKHLKNVIENGTPSEVQNTFEKHYSHIYFVFYENFLLAESNLRLRGSHRTQREELDSILAVFEQILINLPDLVYRRWQYHSIDTIIKKLLHTQNSIKVRREGLNFFLLWLRALRENALPHTILVYACLIPGFPPPKHSDGKPYSLEWLVNAPINEEYGVHPSEITSLVPPSAGEKHPSNPTKYFLDALLESMVINSQTLNWKDKEKSSLESFSFMWDLFKQHYLPHAFENFNYATSIYSCDLALPEPRHLVTYLVNASETGALEAKLDISSDCPMLTSKVSIIKWIVAFVGLFERKDTLVMMRPNSIVHEMQKQVLKQLLELTGSQNNREQDDADTISSIASASVASIAIGNNISPNPDASNSNTSTLTEKEPSISSLSSLDDKLQASTSADEETVRRVLFSTRQNVNVIHELFRQAFMLPLTEVATMRRVVKVYQQWIQHDDEMPVFMKYPPAVDSLDNGKGVENSLRNTSYMRGQLRPLLDESNSESQVCTGPETTYQLFITNSAHVFLVRPPQNAPKLVKLQVDVCKRVLNLYRHLVMNINLSDVTWSQLLRILLHITRIMLQEVEDSGDDALKHHTVSGKLASPVFQTLIVSWIKANLYVHVSTELWNELVDVLSSLCHWEELITEWSKNMETITRVLSRKVYQIDLQDLPLDRLTEQKHKKRKAGMKDHRSKGPLVSERSFSRGWSQDSLSVGEGQVKTSRSTSTSIGQPEEKKPTTDRTRLPKFLTADALRPRAQTVPSQAALTDDVTLPPQHSDQSVSLNSSSASESNGSTLKRHMSASDVTAINENLSMRHRTGSEGPGEGLSQDIAIEHSSNHSGLRVAWQHPTHQIHNYNSGSGGDASESTSLSVHSVEDVDEFDVLVNERLQSDGRDKRSEEFWPNEATSLHSQDSASIDTEWNRMVEPASDRDSQVDRGRSSSAPHLIDIQVTDGVSKETDASSAGKPFPLFDAFTNDTTSSSAPNTDASFSPPLTLPPLPPLSQTPPAVPARKGLPLQANNESLCEIHFLTPTSETCSPTFGESNPENPLSLLDFEIPSSPPLAPVPHEDASASSKNNPALFHFDIPAQDTADRSRTASAGDHLTTPPYQLYENDPTSRDSSAAHLLEESLNVSGNSEDNGAGDFPKREGGVSSCPQSDSSVIVGEKSLNPTGVGSIPPCVKLADEHPEDPLATSNNDTTLQQYNTSPSDELSGKLKELSTVGKDSTAESQFNRCERSIMSGGDQPGWYPDVVSALWRRLLGVLGDVNDIEDPYIHCLVFQYLFELWQTLYKLRQNIGIIADDSTTPDNQELIPPLQIMAPWAFKAVLHLPVTHKQGCLYAFQLLCNSTIQREHDIPLDKEHLSQFYLTLHLHLHSTDQDIVNRIIESCPNYFPFCLPASSLLLLDFIYACHAVAASSDMKAPRVQAQIILGSTLCFPNLYRNLPVLSPDHQEPSISECNNVKDYIVEALLTSCKKDPSYPARCVALSSTGLWLYEELTSTAQRHSRVKEAINVLLVSLKFSNRTVASVACSQLHLLTHCSADLLEYMPEMAPRIIEVMSLSISSLLSNDAKNTEAGRQLIVSLLVCILDWCMAVPLDLLTHTYGVQSDKRLIKTVFKAIQTAALGKPGHSAKHSYSLSDLATKDFDPNLQLDKVQESQGPFIRSKQSNSRSNRNNVPLGTDNAIRLAAHTVLNHLVNHLGHFPLARGASVLSSIVSEHHDLDDAPDDLSPSLFDSPALQFLIYNDTCLLSVLELPAQRHNASDGPCTGLTTANRFVRFVVRDSSGKYCWDASVIHGPSDVTQSTTPVSCQPLSALDEEIGKAALQSCQVYMDYADTEANTKRLIEEASLPRHETPVNGKCSDELEQLLQYLGHTSPECQSTFGSPLNIPSAPPSCVGLDLQDKTTQRLLRHHESLGKSYNANARAANWKAPTLRPRDTQPPRMPFHYARLLCAEMGFLSRDSRHRFYHLTKNERLLRELKNLDSRNCRETHKVAVFYIAIGQEDKMSILSNTGGSEGFEEFVAGLGWEVDLKTHCGFRGKLQSDGSNGQTTPYYATSTLEVIFHVATRFPSDQLARNVKIRHLGNDEVHIVWSEHHRDYRRGIIPTEFGDVLIIIYPIRHNLFRIQIVKKPEIPYFGPLFDGAVVNARVLPVLVRETAINAGRAKRSLIDLYQPFYKERTSYLRQIIEQFKDEQCFEDYCSNIFSPAFSKSGSTLSPGSSPSDSSPFSPKVSSSTSTDAFSTNSNNNNSSSVRHRKPQAPPPPHRIGATGSDLSSDNLTQATSARRKPATSSVESLSESSIARVSDALSFPSSSFNANRPWHSTSGDPAKPSRSSSMFRKPQAVVFHSRPSQRGSSQAPPIAIAEENVFDIANFPTPPQSPPTDAPPMSGSQ